jgi:predicted Zn-dependent peptidase
MERHEHVRSVSAGVWVKVGSGAETASYNGVSHFLEHMVFKGTRQRSSLEIATVLESLGGDLNAFTDREVTCYYSTVLSEHVDIALDVLGDLTLNPTFPKAEIELEKKVLLQELSMVEESPDDKIYDIFFRNVWKDQALGRPVIGTRETIESFDRTIAQRFFQKYYHPTNMVISIAGNIDLDAMVEKCEKVFTAQKAKKVPAKPKNKVAYYPVHKKSVTSSDQLHLIVGFEGLSVHDPDKFNALVLNFYLGGGMSSRLFQEIREKAGLAYTVDCDFLPFSQAGLCAIYLALQPKSLGKCLKILGREIKGITEQPISAKALALVKSQIKGSIILSSEHTEARQENLGRNEICFGRHITPEEIVREIDKVTPEGVQRVAQRLFVPEKESSVTLSRLKPQLKEVSLFL